MSTGLLPFVPHDCSIGRHAELLDEAPLIGTESVEVLHRCPACNTHPRLTSWTRAAWDKRHTAGAARRED